MADDITSQFRNRRIILVPETIDERAVSQLRTDIVAFSLVRTDAPIKFLIDSRRGDPGEVLGLLSTMATSSVETIGLVDGKACPLGVAILSACNTRLMTPLAILSIDALEAHIPYMSGVTTKKELCDQMHFIDERQKRIDTHIAARAGMTIEALLAFRKKHRESGIPIHADTALEYGLIDETADGKAFIAGKDARRIKKIGFA